MEVTQEIPNQEVGLLKGRELRWSMEKGQGREAAVVQRQSVEAVIHYRWVNRGEGLAEDRVGAKLPGFALLQDRLEKPNLKNLRQVQCYIR